MLGLNGGRKLAVSSVLRTLAKLHLSIIVKLTKFSVFDQNNLQAALPKCCSIGRIMKDDAAWPSLMHFDSGCSHIGAT